VLFSIVVFGISIIDYLLSENRLEHAPKPRETLLLLGIINLYLIPISYVFVAVVFALQAVLSFFGILSADHPNTYEPPASQGQ
jgi:hypothetical protein